MRHVIFQVIGVGRKDPSPEKRAKRSALQPAMSPKLAWELTTIAILMTIDA